jgi:hypothetical protein
MNVKTTYVLFGLLVVIFAIFAIVLFYDPGSKDLGNYVLPQFHAEKEPLKVEDIDRVEIQRNEPNRPTIVLQREGSKQWLITEPLKARADGAAVENLVRQLADATRAKSDPHPSLAAWGLEPPHEVITLSKGAERTVKVNIGKESGVGTDAVIYVQDPERPKDPMAVRKTYLDAVFKDLPDYRDPVLLATTSDTLKGIKISEGKKEPVELENQDGHWRYTIPADYGDAEAAGAFAPSDSTKAPSSINVLQSNITNLKLDKPAEDIIADNVPDTDLAKYNLDDKSDVLHVQVKISGRDKPAELLIGVGKKAEKKKDETVDKYHAMLAGEHTVVRVKATDADALRALLDDRGALRNRTLIATEQPIEAIDVDTKTGSGLVRLRRQEGRQPPTFPGQPPSFGDTWTLWRDESTSAPVDPPVMSAPDSLLNLLKQKNSIVLFIDRAPAEKQAEQEKELELTNQSVTVSIWAGDDGIAKDDAKDEKPKDDKKDDKTKKEDKPKTLPKLKSSEPTYRVTFGKRLKENERELVVVKRETKHKIGDRTSYDVTLAKVPVLLLDKAKKGPLGYMSKELPPYSPPNFSIPQHVTKLLIQRPGSPWEMTRAKDSEPWTIVNPPQFAKRMADTAKINNLLMNLNGINANELVEENVKDTDVEKLKKYGLDAPAIKAEITITKDDKPTTYTVRFGKEGPKDGTQDTYYGKVSWFDTVFTFGKTFVDQWPSDFQDTTVAKFDPANVKTLKLTGWQKIVGAPVVLDLERKDSTSWTVKAPPGYNLDADKVKSLLTSMSNLKAEKFVGKLPKPDAELEVEKGGLVIEMTFEKDAQPIKIVVGKLDGETYLATSSAVPDEVFQVKKSLFDGPKSAPAYFAKASP